MRGKDMLEAVAYVDADLIETAERAPIVKRKRHLAPMLGAAAACAAAIAGVVMWHSGGDAPLPVLPEVGVQSSLQRGGMGVNGLLAYSASEIVNANPWKEGCKLKSLPVYKNTLTFIPEMNRMKGGDTAKMTACLKESAAALGIAEGSLTVTESGFREEERKRYEERFAENGTIPPDFAFSPNAVQGCSEIAEMEVNEAMDLYVRFLQPRKLPAGSSASFDALTQKTESFADVFGALLGYAKPCTDVYGGYYSADYEYGDVRQMWFTAVYEGSGDLAEQIVGYNFRRTEFVSDAAGVSSVTKYQPDLSQKLGDYPIIPVKEAKALLAEGKYLSEADTVPAAKQIAKTELIYGTSPYADYFVPFYRFYVEDGESSAAQGLKYFAVYDVPAIPAQYITDMPAHTAQ